jgi:lipoprotein-releasing system ATP-binding protein
VGASGAGKSTLLHLLGGLDRPDDGKVFYEQKNIFDFDNEKLAKFRNENMGFVFQFHHLLPEFTAIENVAIPQMIKGISLKNSLEKSKKILDMVGLSDRADHKPAELSGGEQQRVAVARALANDPKIILADEPTGNLDSANSESIHKLLFELRDNFKKTFVIVTHNPALMKLADIIFEIKDGVIKRTEN